MVNDRMPEYCAERASKILNRDKKAMNGSRILILGVAYKQDIDDYRESPALRVIEALEQLGADVIYYDPFVSTYHEHGAAKHSEPELSAELISGADLVIITTAHTTVDYKLVQESALAIFDTKNAMKHIENRENIELL